MQESNLEEASDEVFEKIIQDINSQIPEELKEYFYSKCKSMGIDDFIPQLSEEEIKDVANLDFDEKIEKIAGASSANQKKIVETLQSDEEKLKVMQLANISQDVKETIVQSLQSDDSKIEALRENEFFDYFYEEVILSLQDDRSKLEALDLIKRDRSKVKIIQSMEDESVKVEALSQVDEIYDKVDIIVSIEDEKNLINAINELPENIEGIGIGSMKELIKKVSNLQDDNIKMKLATKFSEDILSYYDYNLDIIDILAEEENKLKIIDTIPGEQDKSYAATRLEKDEDKLKIIDELNSENCKVIIAKSLKEEENVLKIIDQLEDEEEIADLAVYLEKDENKLKVIEEIQKDTLKSWIAENLEKDESKIEAVKNINDEFYKLNVAEKLEDDKFKLEVLKHLKSDVFKTIVVQTCKDVENVYKGLREIGIKEEKINTLKRLYEKNCEVISEINIGLLDEKYISTLGEDKINFISNFGNIQDKILRLTDKEYEVFYKCIDDYVERTGTDEWSVLANQILETLGDRQYNELIKNIENLEDVDLEQLIKIIQDDNDFDIKTVEDIENYSEIKKNKCEGMINSDIDLDQKKTAVLQKIFGHSVKYAENIVNKYGKCIDKTKDKGLKDYVQSLRLILDTENEEVLKDIYNNLDEIEFFVDKVNFERDLKTEYGKLYNEGLFNPDNATNISQEELNRIKVKDDNGEEVNLEEEFKGVNVYNAGTDFKMLVTSVAPYVDRNKKIPNYKGDWNRPAIGSQHFCASYIRQDMLGCAPIPHVAYGFSSMDEEALMLSGSSDMVSTGESFVSKVYRENTQINETTVYNEMDYRRIQKGEKKQPDYIIAFKIEGKIENLEDIKQAYNDWEEELPIVIVDVDECLREEERRTEELVEKYDKTTDEVERTKIAKEITQKVRNNQVTLEVHYNYNKRNDKEHLLFYTDNDREKEENLENIQSYYENNKDLLYKKTEEQKNEKDEVKEQDLEEIYEDLTPTERNEVIGSIKSIIEKQTEKEGERGYD